MKIYASCFGCPEPERVFLGLAAEGVGAGFSLRSGFADGEPDEVFRFRLRCLGAREDPPEDRETGSEERGLLMEGVSAEDVRMPLFMLFR